MVSYVSVAETGICYKNTYSFILQLMKTSFFCKLDIVPITCVPPRSYFFQKEYLECIMTWKLHHYPCGNSVGIAALLLSVIYMEVYLWVYHPLSQEWTGYTKGKQLLKWNQLYFLFDIIRITFHEAGTKYLTLATYRQKSVFWLIVYGYKSYWREVLEARIWRH